MKLLRIGSDSDVLLWGLKDAGSSTYISTATVTFSLFTAAGSLVSGASGVSMPCDDATRGSYSGVLPHTVALTEGAEYYILITATAVDGSVGQWKISCVAGYEGPD